MNAKEFLHYLDQHLAPPLGKVTPEHLQRWEGFGVLRPHPEYSKDDIHTVMSLIKMEQSLQKAPQSTAQEKPPLPSAASGTIYQVLSILKEATTEADAKEKAIIRLVLLNSGLISTLGFVYINFSPFTGNTLESLLKVPEYKSRFATASASKELLIIREATQFVEGETDREILTVIGPVLFVQGVRPTLVYSSFIFGSKGRLLGPGQYAPSPRSLYEEFLDSDMQSLDDITNFMAAHLMVGALGVPPGEDVIDFIKVTQKKMRWLLMKATRGTLGVADLSPLSPFHEDGVIDASILAEMGGMDIFAADGKPVSVGEIKMSPAYKWEGQEWAPYDKNKLHIRRYYQWLDFMWAELIDAVTHGSQTPVCLRCGKLLPQKRGRRKTYCGPENPECYYARKAKYVRTTRSRDR